MKKFMRLFSVFLLVFGIAGAASAVTITYDYDTAPGNTLTTLVSSATVETFDSPLLWTWTGNFEVVSGSLSGKYAAPYNSSEFAAADTTDYVTVPASNDTDGIGSVEVTDLGGTYYYFGIFWGSVDTYNTLAFYNGATLVDSFTGSEAINPSDANGNQTAPSTNLYVNFYFGPGEGFDRFIMSSSQFAFEADNIALAVPEPATMLLLGTGLVGLAGLGRKKFRKK